MIVLNSGPSGTVDAGIAITRYQTSNNTGTGDIVNDTFVLTAAVQNSSLTTVVFPGGASSVDSFYNNYWIKITSGLAINNVRQITGYVGSTRTATLSSALSGLPSATVDTFNLYGNLYVNSYFKESTKEYTVSYAASTPGSTVSDINYVNMKIGNLRASLVTTSNLLATNISVANITLPSNVTFTNLVTTTMTSGTVRVTGNADLTGGLTSTTNFTATLGTIATLLSTSILATNFSTLNSTITSETVGSINATSVTSVNGSITTLSAGSIVATSVTVPSLITTNYITTNATATNLFLTNITVPNIYTTNITTKNFLVSGNTTTSNFVYIDCQSSTTNPGALVFKNSSGTGDVRIYGDGGDLQWIGGGSRALQMGAYHEIRLKGGSSTGTPIVQLAGSSSAYNTIIENTADSIGLRVYGNGTQTQDLTQWTSSGGTTVYTRVDKLGNIQVTSTADSISAFTGGSITTSGGVSIGKSADIGSTTTATNTSTGALVVSGGAGFNGDIYAKNIYSNNVRLPIFGTEYNYVESLGLSSSVVTTYTLKSSLTTGSLIGGLYKVNVGWTFAAGSSTSAKGQFLALLDATAISTGTVLSEHVEILTNSTRLISPRFTSTTFTLSAGVHTMSLVWKTLTAAATINISNARLELFRVS